MLEVKGDMSLGTFSDSALMIIGHGTTSSDGASQAVLEHVEAIRKLGAFREVHGAFWKQTPSVEEVFSQIRSERVFLVPFFISEGYFSDIVIPRALGFLEESGVLSRRLVRDGRTFFYTRVVGGHSGVTDLILARSREVVERFPFPRCPPPGETTLFIAGHGTLKNTKSREGVELQATRIAGMGIYSHVKAVFLEESPRISDCFSLAATRHLVVVPFFASEGMHVREDIPVLLGEPSMVVQRRLAGGQPSWRNPTERQGKLAWYAKSVGSSPAMPGMIMDLAREAASGG